MTLNRRHPLLATPALPLVVPAPPSSAELPFRFQHGLPFKLHIPAKLGFASLKLVTTTCVIDKMPCGCRRNRGYNRFSGS